MRGRRSWHRRASSRGLERGRRGGTRPGGFQAGLGDRAAFETLAGLARDGKTNKGGAPGNPLLLALARHEYEDEIYLVGPPLALRRAVFGALAKVARLLGHQAAYPYPYGRRNKASRTTM